MIRKELRNQTQDYMFVEFMLLITNLYTISAVLRRTALQSDF